MDKNKQASTYCCTLVQTTHQLLLKDERTLPMLYAQTGIPFSWLRKFKSRRIKEPQACRVQKLYEHLTGTKLQLGAR